MELIIEGCGQTLRLNSCQCHITVASEIGCAAKVCFAGYGICSSHSGLMSISGCHELQQEGTAGWKLSFVLRSSWRNKGWGDNIFFRNFLHFLFSKVCSCHFPLCDSSLFIDKIYKALKKGKKKKDNLVQYLTHSSETRILNFWSDSKWGLKAKFGLMVANRKHVYFLFFFFLKAPPT